MPKDTLPWLESAGFHGRVAEGAFQKPPPFPYLNFTEDQSFHGGDFECGLCTHTLTVELFSSRIDRRAEARLEQLFQETGFEKHRTYYPGDRFYVTAYELNYTEKV